MQVYQLTSLGNALSSNINPKYKDDKSRARWEVLYYLRRNGAKDAETIIANTGASQHTLAYLSAKKLIFNNNAVMA